jgi:hypothetical protein
MPQIFDPLIIFIASNAIFLAIGAVFSTISNEIFVFEKIEKAENPKYNSHQADALRKNITRYMSASIVIYFTNFIFIMSFLIVKYILRPLHNSL